MHIRDEWIKNTEFHPHSTADVLNEVIARAKAVLDAKKLPIVVFDLDSTLFDVSKRSYEILREWAEWIPRRLNGQSMQQGGGDRQRARQLVSRHGRFRRGVGTENAVALPRQI